MLKSQLLTAISAAKLTAGDLLFDAKLVIRTQAAHVPGSATTYTEVLHDVKVCWDKFKTHEIDGERIRVSDLRAIVFPEVNVPTPQPNQLIRVGTVNYRIVDNDKVMAGDTLALSRLQLRLQ